MLDVRGYLSTLYLHLSPTSIFSLNLAAINTNDVYVFKNIIKGNGDVLCSECFKSVPDSLHEPHLYLAPW